MQAGTLWVRYVLERSFRDRVRLHWILQKERRRITSVLGACLPRRLLKEPLQVPLIETFEHVTVMFCR